MANIPNPLGFEVDLRQPNHRVRKKILEFIRTIYTDVLRKPVWYPPGWAYLVLR